MVHAEAILGVMKNDSFRRGDHSLAGKGAVTIA